MFGHFSAEHFRDYNELEVIAENIWSLVSQLREGENIFYENTRDYLTDHTIEPGLLKSYFN